jgi:hypothetical protein
LLGAFQDVFGRQDNGGHVVAIVAVPTALRVDGAHDDHADDLPVEPKSGRTERRRGHGAVGDVEGPGLLNDAADALDRGGISAARGAVEAVEGDDLVEQLGGGGLA